MSKRLYIRKSHLRPPVLAHRILSVRFWLRLQEFRLG